MLTTNIKMTPELQLVFDEVVKPLDNNNVCTVVTLMSDGTRYFQEYEDVPTGVHGYTNELVWALEHQEFVTDVVCFILESSKDEAPKYLFHAYGFDGTNANVPEIALLEEAPE